MRIAQLTIDYSANGGVGVYLLNLCAALETAGHEVAVVHAHSNVSLLSLSVSHRFHVEGFDRYGTEDHSRTGASCIMEILEAVNPDIVHIQANNNFLLEAEIRQRFPAIKSLHVYDFCPSGNKFHHALGKICHHSTGPLCVARMGYKRCILSISPAVIWWHYRRCVEANQNNGHYPTLIAASKYVKHQAVATGYPPRQIEVVPYFTRLPLPYPATGGGENTILFVGRVVREKGLDRLMSAVTLVRVPLRLVVAGDGPDLDRAKELARCLGLNGRTEFVGWVEGDRGLQLYREASIVVVPSVWPEPFGIVGLEAMSYGKPVVAFNIGGIPEWLEDGVTGLLVEPDDVSEMAEKISYLLEHPDVAHEMGMRGRKRVEREFNKEKHITRLLEIYREVMDGWTQPPTLAH